MTDERVEEWWQQFRTLGVPANASPAMLAQARLAFFGGASALLVALRVYGKAVDLGIMSADEMSGSLEAWWQEVRACFDAERKRGKGGHRGQ
jgi:hypothetical protein